MEYKLKFVFLVQSAIETFYNVGLTSEKLLIKKNLRNAVRHVDIP